MIGELRDNEEINDHEERVKEMAEALNMIPVSVIEDIKAEIERMKDIPEQGTWRAACDEAIAVIDKHTSRKENIYGTT